MIDSALLPWQQGDWQRLLQLRQADRLPHALLLSGLPGIGIGQFARRLAGALMCSSAGADACGHCHACCLNAAGNHPDLMVLEPEKEGGAIKVDQVRELVAFGQATAQLGGYRAVILRPAEAMNVNAANSLLKTLEEPGADTLLVLISYAPGTVLPTIRSRCQLMPMSAPDATRSREWLQGQLSGPESLELLHAFAPQQPLYALRLEPVAKEMQAMAESLPALIEGQADPLQAASSWTVVDPGQLLLWLYRWLSSACLAGEGRTESELAVRIHRSWTARSPLLDLVALLDELVALRRQLASGANPNRDLLLENLALRLSGQAAHC